MVQRFVDFSCFFFFFFFFSQCNGSLIIAEGVGSGHTCVLQPNIGIKCWGVNSDGQLGYGDTINRGNQINQMGNNLDFVDLGNDFIPVQVSIGRGHSCALSLKQNIKCWGLNHVGQLGYGDTNNRGDESNEMGNNLPVIDLGKYFIPQKIELGAYHTCVLSIDYKIKCWGYNYYRQLGYNDDNNRGDHSNEMGNYLLPINLNHNSIPIDISLGYYHCCVLFQDHSIKCWGDNRRGQLGYGNVNLGTNFIPIEIKLGGYVSCALSSDHRLKCWGNNDAGQLGYGDVNNRGDQPNEMDNNLLPIQFGSNFIPKQISVSGYHICVLSFDDRLKCFGWNKYGQLGYDDNQNRGDEPNEMNDYLPVINLGSDFIPMDVRALDAFTCALSKNDKIKCWGRNQYGQLGYEDTKHRGDNSKEMGNYLLPLDFGSNFFKCNPNIAE